jgi:hypothetical protein
LCFTITFEGFGKVANKVDGVTMTIFFSNALLYNWLSLLIATAKAGSIGTKRSTKSGDSM